MGNLWVSICSRDGRRRTGGARRGIGGPKQLFPKLSIRNFLKPEIKKRDDTNDIKMNIDIIVYWIELM